MSAQFQSVQGKAVRLLLQGLFCLLVVAELLGPSLYAQGLGSAIQGTVTDSTGAVVPGAAIAATNMDTGLQRSVTSNASGIYVISNLPPGRYRVQVSLAGFQTNVRENVELVVGQQLVLNTALQIGEITQQVTVTGEAPLVDTSTAQVAGLVAERQVRDLPLNGRSFDNLIALNPAMVNTDAVKQGSSSSTGPGNYFSIGGRRPGENIFLWNGVEYAGGTGAVSSTPGGVSGQLLGIEAVREFNVIPNIDSAEFGHRAGGQVGIVTQSGTNAFHGSFYEFLRNSALDARDYFDYPTGLRIPPFKRNQFGLSAGGPIQKDKTFIFGNYEGFRQRLGLSSDAIVPDAQARRGFLPCNVAASAPNFVKPPCTGSELVNVNMAPGVVPYIALWPEPNGSELTVNGLPTGTAHAFNNPPNPIREDFGIVRADRTISEKDSFSASYTVDDGENVSAGQNPFSLVTNIQRAQVLSLNEIHVFSPNVVNNFTAGYSRTWFRFVYSLSIAPPGVQPYVAGTPPGQINIGGGQGNTAIIAAGSGPNTGHDQLNVDNIFTYNDQLRITKGIHSIATGAWLERLQSNSYSGNYGIMTFPNLQSFLQGTPSLFAVTGAPAPMIPWRVWLGAWFVQDSMKLRPNLTFSLGVRHEFTNGWHANNQMAGNFVQGPDGVLLTQPVTGDSLFTTNRAKRLIGPRAALAWDPFGKGTTSIRAGWGIAYNLLDNVGWCCINIPPIAGNSQLANPPFPLQIVPGVTTLASSTPGGGRIGTQPDPHTPTVVNYRFEIEQAVGRDMTLRVAYLGSRGYHEITRGDANKVLPAICPASPCPAGLPNGTKYFPAGALRRRNPNLGTMGIFFSSAVNNFNGFYIDLNRRFRGGLAFRANYTHGKSLDNSSSITGSQAGGNPGVIMDPDDRMRDYGLSVFDVRDRLSMNSTYELPLGAGKTFLTGATGITGKLVSGWQVNAILGLQSGFPFTPILGFSQSRDGDTGFPDRPDMAPGRTRSGIYTDFQKTGRWVDPTAFALQVPGTYGNAGRNILIGPGLVSLDMSLFKTTRLTERWGLQFRAETFNLPNRSNFGIPNGVMLTPSGAPASSAGLITKTAVKSRQIQFGMKLTF